MANSNPLQAAREEVKGWVDRILETTPGPEEPLFPVNLLEDGRPAGQKLQPILDWLSREGPPIAILSGPLGSGKTVATCLVHRALSTQGEAGALDLWAPMGRVDPNTSPIRGLLDAVDVDMGVGPVLDAPLRCLILDGVDEFAYRCSSRQLLEWFSQLCRDLDLVRPRPRLVISGRDVVFSSRNVFTDLLRGFCFSSTHGRFDQLHRFGLEPWNEDFYREQLAGFLQERLRSRFGSSTPAEVEHRLRLIAQGVLTSPLFYGLAYEYLSDPDAPREVLQDQQQLMHRWVLRILNDPWRNRGTPIPTEERLQAAIGISTFLVLSGRGTAGATLEELERERTLQEIWDRLRSQPDSTPEDGESSLNPTFAQAIKELKHTTLMGVKGDRYAPFHEQVLIHLAAEGIGRLLAPVPVPGDEGGGGAPPGLDYFLDAKHRSDVSQARNLSALRRHEALLAYMSFPAEPVLFMPGSTLERTLDYRFRPHAVGSPLAEVEQEALSFEKMFSRSAEALPLAPLRHLLRGEEPFDPRKTILVSVRDAALRARPDKREGLLEDERREILAETTRVLASASLPDSIEAEGQILLPIPAGEYVIWDLEEDFRRLIRVRLEQTIYLGQSPCTVEQYARFLSRRLASELSVELPRQPSVRWSLREGSVTYEPTLAEMPVTGISAGEAEQYCRWLGSQALPENLQAARVELPSPEALRIAIQGLEIWELPAREGPFGHLGLIDIWHWTAKQDGVQQVLVGGSQSIGSVEVLRRGWPALDRRLPPTSYEPDTGFRVSLMLR